MQFDKDKDLENLMMLNAFDDSLANTRLYYGDKLFNSYGRNAKLNLGEQQQQLKNNINRGSNNLNQGFLSQRAAINKPQFNHQQKYRNEVFGGFGELFWDQKQNNQPPNQSQILNNSYNIPFNNTNVNQSMPSPNKTNNHTPYYPQQSVPQQNVSQQNVPQQSVFQRNSSQILQTQPQSYSIYNQPQTQRSYQTKTPLKQQSYMLRSSYNIPQQTPLKSTAYSQSVLETSLPPVDDPLTNLLVKQGKLMESLSTTIEKETQKQEKLDLKRLKKKLDLYEEKQKHQKLESEYQNTYGKKMLTDPDDSRYSYDPNNPYKQFERNNPYNLFDPKNTLKTLDPYNPQNQYRNNINTDPFGQLTINQNKNNGESKQSKVDTIKMTMLMRKLAVENELLRNGAGGQKSSRRKGKSKKGKSRRQKKKKNQNAAADEDDDEDDEDYDDFDDYDDYDSEDDWYDSDDDYYDDDDEDDQDQGPPPPPQETEEEKKKREEEEQKKQKQIRIKELFRRFRLVKVRAMFPIMYFNTIKYQISEKKTLQQKKMNEDLSTLFDNVTNWVQKVCSRGLNLIQDQKASCDISKKLSDKEMRKRIDNLKLRVKAFLDGLADNCKEEDIGIIAVQIFGQLTNSFNFPPQQFLYKFEINRLKYTQFGALNEVNGRQQLMLLLMFIIIRVLILRILFKPWNFSEKIKETPELKLNAKTISSVIYEILIEYLRNSCPPIQNNQSMLSAEKKIKEIPKIPAATNDPVDPIIYRDAQKNDEPVLLGLFQRNQIEVIFEGVENSTWIETMKSTIQGLGESLVQTVNKKYDEMKAKQKQENQSNKQNISSLLSKNLGDKEFLKKLKDQQKQD